MQDGFELIRWVTHATLRPAARLISSRQVRRLSPLAAAVALAACDSTEPMLTAPEEVTDLVTASAVVTPYDNGLVLWYHFDKGAGESNTLVKDFSGNGRDARCSGSGCPTFTTAGRYGGAAQFDGSNDVLSTASLTPPSRGTIAFWFQTDLISRRQRFLGSHDAFEAMIEKGGQVAHNFFTGGSAYLKGPQVSTRTWRHAVFTWDASSRRQEIWLDGKLVASGTSARDTPPGGVIELGSRTGAGDHFAGRMDELAMWNRVLSASEITALFTSAPGEGAVGGDSPTNPQPPSDTKGPTVAVTAPANRDTLSGVVNITASASDDGGVSSVKFNVDGKTVGTDTSSPYSFSWNTTNVSDGARTITAVATDAAGNATTSAAVNVTVKNTKAPEPETPPPPPPLPPAQPVGEWDNVVQNTTINGNLVIPAGQRWLIGPNVRVAGNVLVENSTMGMRPGSSLEIVGADPSRYAGGGMHYTSAMNNDRGVWVWGSGQLDIACTPKTGWNRTGSDPSWKSTDEYWIAPTTAGDFRVRRWSPGQPIPRIDPRVPAAEIVNVTRDCSIKGPGHIHVNSTSAQRVEYVRLENLGISRSGGPVLGRYALHLHMSGNGTRGTMIRGVAAVSSRGTVFVPHASHGVTMIDNVSVNSYAEALWWDHGHETNDLLVDRMAVLGVEMPREVSGSSGRHDGYTLGVGNNKVIRNSVAAGVCCNKLTVGFDWPEPTPEFNKSSDFVWDFAGNVAHNNFGPGVRFWTNLAEPHTVDDHVSYRNGVGGAESGAYLNGLEYRNVLMIQEGFATSDRSADRGGVIWNANARRNAQGRPAQIRDCEISAHTGPAIKVTHRQLPAQEYMQVVDCKLTAGPGEPKVLISAGQNPWKAHFIRSGVTPDDFQFQASSGNEGSHILIDHEDGRRWEVLWQGGKKVVRTR